MRDEMAVTRTEESILCPECDNDPCVCERTPASMIRVKLSDGKVREQEFINFVLEQYVKEGVAELDDQKLPELLEIKYRALANAKHELGDVKLIREMFIGFQKHLYQPKTG